MILLYQVQDPLLHTDKPTGSGSEANTADPEDSTEKASDNWMTGKMWWDGPGVCTRQSGNHTTSTEVTRAPNISVRAQDGPHEQNVLTLCHVTDDVRVCRSLYVLQNGLFQR